MARINNLSQFMYQRAYDAQVKVEDIFVFKPRPYQIEVEDLINNDTDNRLLYVCWCRRCGKDQWAFYYTVKYLYNNPNSRALYVFPTAKQGKMALLDGVTFEKKNWIASIINPVVLQRPRSGSLYFHDNTIRFKNGSMIQFVGDDGDTLVGSNFNIVVISEAAQIKQSTIDYLIPSVHKAGGKIICVSTPRYGSAFNDKLLKDEDILKSILSAKDAVIDDEGTRLYTDEELEILSKRMSQSKFLSEYMVDLSAYEESSIYGDSLSKATMCDMPDLRDQMIFISGDLGASDNSSFVFAVFKDNKLKIIDHYRNRNVPTQHYIDYFNDWILKNNVRKSLVTIILPQDGKNLVDVGRYITSKVEMYRQAGFKVNCINHISVLRGIDITRTAIETGDMEFVKTSSVRNLMNIIKAYEWKKTPQDEIIYVPQHGTGFSASNDADSLEYMCITFFKTVYEAQFQTQSGVIFNYN